MDERSRTTSAWRSSVMARARRSTTGSRSLHQPSESSSVAIAEGERETRNVRFSDQRLAAMANEAAGAIRWDALRKSQLSSRWGRKKSSLNGGSSSSSGGGSGVNGGGIAVYTREDPQSFSVLAKGLLQCGVQELRLVFDTRTSDQFDDVMRTLSPKDFLAGELVHIVSKHESAGGLPSRSSRAASTYSDTSSVRTASGGDPAAADLLVSAVTFEKANVFARNEEWCFLEYLQDNASVVTSNSSGTNSSSNESLSVNKKPWFTKTLLSLHPDDCFFGRVAQRAKHGHDVLAGFHFEEEQDGRSTRVTFSGEMFYSGGSDNNKHSNKDSASNRVVRARLLKMAQWIVCLADIVRRRRLGIQVLADRRQIKVLNSHCVCCRRSFLMARKKSCALCGYYVCERCSAIEQRETCTGVYECSAIESIRVCDTCIVRVDQCRYAHVTKRTLRPARVVPDVFEASRVSGSTSAMRSRATTGVVLTNLLQETMTNASAARKKSALSVIRYLVDQEDSDAFSDTGSTGTNSSSNQQQQRHPHHRKITLTEASTDAQYFAALQTRLNDRPLPVDQCVLANNEKRSYAIEYPPELDQVIVTPVPANEAARLQLLKDEHLVGESTAEDAEDGALEPVPELDIICAIASKELGCSGSLITIVDKDRMRVIASTLASFASKSFPRDQGFCTQTILSDKPLLVPHPEADVRFAHIIPVKHMNVSFYCGFPMLAADKTTVIGSVCCVDHESRELTQSQYTVMSKLAETASRVVQMQAKTRKRLAATGPQGSAYAVAA